MEISWRFCVGVVQGILIETRQGKNLIWRQCFGGIVSYISGNFGWNFIWKQLATLVYTAKQKILSGVGIEDGFLHWNIYTKIYVDSFIEITAPLGWQCIKKGHPRERLRTSQKCTQNQENYFIRSFDIYINANV